MRNYHVSEVTRYVIHGLGDCGVQTLLLNPDHFGSL